MNKYFIGLGLIFITFIGTAWFLYDKGREKPVQYETSKPEVRTIIKKTVATGAIKPKKEVMLKSQVPGVVEKIYVTPGTEVKAGEKIAKIKLIPSPANINSAESSIEQLRLQLKEAEAELARQRRLNSSGAAVGDAQIALQEAEKELARQQPLYEEGIISEQAYRQLKANVATQKAILEQAQTSASSSLSQFELNVEIRREELQAAKDNLQILRDGASRKSKEVSNVITSTLSGMVLDIPVEEGGFVIESNSFNEGTTIASVADMNELEFEGKVAESEVGKLTEGMPLLITVGAIEDQKFDAKLSYIAPKGIEEEGSIQFEIKADVVPPEDVFIRAGYSANADIILGKRDSVLSVNERDIIFKGDSTLVEIETGEQTFEERLIEVGLSDGIYIEVKNGVTTSDKLKIQEGGGEQD